VWNGWGQLIATEKLKIRQYQLPLRKRLNLRKNCRFPRAENKKADPKCGRLD
jgi:hypothetical protein